MSSRIIKNYFSQNYRNMYQSKRMPKKNIDQSLYLIRKQNKNTPANYMDDAFENMKFMNILRMNKIKLEFVYPHQMLDETLTSELKLEDEGFTEALLIYNYKERNIIQDREPIVNALQNSGLANKGKNQSQWENFGVKWVQSNLQDKLHQIETVFHKNFKHNTFNKPSLIVPYEKYNDPIELIDKYFQIQFNTMKLSNMIFWGKDHIDSCDLQMFTFIQLLDMNINTFSLYRKSQLFSKKFEVDLLDQIKLTGFSESELIEQGNEISKGKVIIDPLTVKKNQDEWLHELHHNCLLDYKMNDKQVDPDDKITGQLNQLVNYKK